MSREIVVIGSINMDLVAHATTLPRPGETVLGKSFRTFHGGKGANQAVAAARLGGSVAMIGKVGSDAFGVELRESLANSGVDVTGVGVAECSSGLLLLQPMRKLAILSLWLAEPTAFCCPKTWSGIAIEFVRRPSFCCN